MKLVNRGLIFIESLVRKRVKKTSCFIVADLIQNNAKKFEFFESLNIYFNKSIFFVFLSFFCSVRRIQQKWKEFRLKIKYFKILIHKLWNKYFFLFAMNFAEKGLEKMDQAMFY